MCNVYFYRVSFSWYEEYAPVVFYSEKKYSKEEFNDLIKKLAEETVEELIEKHDSWIGNDEIMSGIIDFDIIKGKMKNIKIIVKGVWERLKDHGFKEVKYQVDYNMWGSSIIKEEDIEEYKKYLDEETLKKIVEHNEKIRARINSSMKELWKRPEVD